MIEKLQKAFLSHQEEGSCLKFALWCYSVDKKIKLYDDGDHIVCNLEGKFFDKDKLYFHSEINKFVPSEGFGYEYYKSSFRELLNPQEEVLLEEYFKPNTNEKLFGIYQIRHREKHTATESKVKESINFYYKRKSFAIDQINIAKYNKD